MPSSELLERARALAAELKRRTQGTAPLVPHKPTPKQAQFLALTEKEALFGGAAGGGKSDAALMDALSIAHVPHAASLVLRRTMPELEQADGLIPRSHEWLRGKADWNEQKHRWTFRNGFTLAFGHMEHEDTKYRYQGGAWQRILFEELTHFTETQYRYMLSRARIRSKVVQAHGVIPHVRATANPGGPGHFWVKRRFVDPGDPARPFIQSRLEDNPHLDQADYLASLASLDATTFQQLRWGEWVDDAGGRIYQFTERNLVADVPDWGEGGWRYILAIDLGASEANPSTAFVVLAWHDQIPDAVWCVEAAIFAGGEPDDMVRRIRDYRRRYSSFEREVMDEGALGVAIGKAIRSRGIGIEAANKADKPAQRRMLMAAIQQGTIQLLMPQCADLVEEARHIRWDKDGLDAAKGVAMHLTDALRYGYSETKAFRSRAPATPPEPNSAAWQRAREKAELDSERARVRRRKELGFWQSGNSR